MYFMEVKFLVNESELQTRQNLFSFRRCPSKTKEFLVSIEKNLDECHPGPAVFEDHTSTTGIVELFYHDLHGFGYIRTPNRLSAVGMRLSH